MNDEQPTAVLVGLHEVVTTAQFADHHGVDVRTVKRWLQAGRIPAAMQDSRGRWRIPVDAAVTMPPPKPKGTAVTRPADAPVSPIGPLGALIPIKVYADAMNTEVGRIKRMGRDGVLVVGPYGRGGTIVVVVPPTR